MIQPGRLRSWPWICRVGPCVRLRVSAHPTHGPWDHINLQLILGVGRGPRTMKRAHGPWGAIALRFVLRDGPTATIRWERAVQGTGQVTRARLLVGDERPRVDLRTLNKDSAFARNA